VIKRRYPGVTIIEGEAACTGCTGELIGALSAIREAASVSALYDLTVILGNPTETSTTTKTIVLGKCARKLAHLGYYVKGCPPRDDDVIRAISKVCGLDAESVITSRNLARERTWAATQALLEQ
jgi:Ni,Fe-hydrogenase III small subunit